MAILLVVALVIGWWSARILRPELTGEQVQSVYDPHPDTGTRWEPPRAMERRPSRFPRQLRYSVSSECQKAAEALFGYLPAGALDGYVAQFGSVTEDSSWGLSSTARYRDRQAAEAGFQAIRADLDRCQGLTLPARYGYVVMTFTGSPVSSSRLGGDRVVYVVDTAADGLDQSSTLTGVRFGNTVSWQNRNVRFGRAATDRDAERFVDALLARMRSVLLRS
ncbi:MAG TPA: hypothetical protein VFP89_00475 [Propionibacteriaceae bacterium]|nr:hypothetical protein [Propionibacteriaceae bacterium]